ncbi:MAG: EscU/YscU/HrcU family type III secretion system export apparatus switch protein [Capsulimonas sp.]|uniref:EscU/YscU/HrcU family type III secretion system export apparatus switch protein n=1 Tax=Capsulimonas sp. TaxID=2494211 RepID=UPI00326771C4
MQDPTQKPTTKNAVALRYDAKAGDAPKVVASGKGFVAEDIVRVAKENNVHIRQDAALAGALSSLEVGSSIPPELFRVVAEVISFVYRQNGKMR